MFLGLPDPFVRCTDSDPSFIKQKKFEKLSFLLFCDFFMIFLSLKNNVNVVSKSKTQDGNKKLFFLLSFFVYYPTF
jgi:hypothetical protein